MIDKEVAKEHAQWWQPEVQAKIDTRARMDPGASFLVDVGGPALSAWVAEECNRILGQELTDSEERTFSDLVT